MKNLVLAMTLTLSAAAAPAGSLDGLWKAKRWYEPQMRATIVVQRDGDAYTADVDGRIFPVTVNGREISFASFRGKLAAGEIVGHWYNPNAFPVRLHAAGANRWIGDVRTIDRTFTFYLLVQKRPDGTLGIVLDNPERDWSAFLHADSIVRDGDVVKLLGKRNGDKEPETLITGTYDAERDRISLPFPDFGGTFDFTREGDDSEFYERPRNSRYVYRKPAQLDDGWKTQSPEDAGIDRDGLEAMIQMLIDRPIDSIDTPVVDALLVARNGKLVLEEYFRGEHREKLHPLRSAQKSLVSIIAGAVMQTGAPLSVDDPVYKVMNGGTFAPDLEPRKRAMTLEHLLTMTSGTACDDWDENAKYNEDAMWENEQNEPDFYRYALNIPMVRDPGEKPVYCSAGANLAMGVIERATGEHADDLFDRLVARPMGIDHYLWPIKRNGQSYGAGGAAFRARDFLKFGQLMLDGGTWNGRRIMSREFTTRSSSPLYLFLPASKDRPERHYGYLWWSLEYPYQGRKVRAFYAGGNGGQAVVVIPELDLVIATYGANYVSAGTYYVQLDVIPNNLLPAVRTSKGTAR